MNLLELVLADDEVAKFVLERKIHLQTITLRFT